MLTDRLKDTGLAPGSSLLDAGCGTGGLLHHLSCVKPDLRLFGIEINSEAASVAAGKSNAIIATGSVNDLPYPDAYFDIMVSADVLCHAAVEQSEALHEMYRCLRPGGTLLVNLPAFRWLFSAHDRHVHSVRRYNIHEATRMMTTGRFKVISSFYWNSLLFPLLLAHRLTIGQRRTSSDVREVAAFQNYLFFTIVAFERKLICRGFRPPFGGSIFIEAQKP